MQNSYQIIGALLTAVVVLGGSTAAATSRSVSLSDAKSAESTYSCTAKNGKYKVYANRSPRSKSTRLLVGLNEWDVSTSKYLYTYKFSITSTNGTTKLLNAQIGNWAKVRLTAEGSKGTGAGNITNEF